MVLCWLIEIPYLYVRLTGFEPYSSGMRHTQASGFRVYNVAYTYLSIHVSSVHPYLLITHTFVYVYIRRTHTFALLIYIYIYIHIARTVSSRRDSFAPPPPFSQFALLIRDSHISSYSSMYNTFSFAYSKRAHFSASLEHQQAASSCSSTSGLQTSFQPYRALFASLRFAQIISSSSSSSTYSARTPECTQY